MEIFLRSAEDAFLHVGSLIGFFILLFGYINYKSSGNFTSIISKNTKLQPLMGAFIGGIPGCGGTLAIMPLYIRGNLSFGSICASLIASLGDASFLLISSNFKLYIFILSVCILTGVLTGYIVDMLNLEKLLKLRNYRKRTLFRGRNTQTASSNIKYLVKDHGNRNKLSYIITHKIGHIFYISILIIGFILMILSHSGLDYEWIDKIHSLEELVAIVGIMSSVIYMYFFKRIFKNENSHENLNKKQSLKDVIVHCAGEISFVITWIYIAYVIYDIFITLVGGESYLTNLVLSTGLISIFIGAILGLIPGCGVQIMLMSFYLKGNIPLGVLVANSISQDGDALFPLIALDKKSSLWITIITTIPAILVGGIVYMLLG